MAHGHMPPRNSPPTNRFYHTRLPTPSRLGEVRLHLPRPSLQPTTSQPHTLVPGWHHARETSAWRQKAAREGHPPAHPGKSQGRCGALDVDRRRSRGAGEHHHGDEPDLSGARIGRWKDGLRSRRCGRENELLTPGPSVGHGAINVDLVALVN
ncbi:hypothetical protein M427DRAFT_175518 [Gonapodya prolifera JEL478]|uniref:Uncharacterized protein n=1 Tax=Gonapodya prolifera (strain JEL478) TaxID=1344416 RepID=A0A139B0Q2_GONPJ|nr:hypothetical protein M427DRAFT_175518 [Gonapodya prolifera JEL478]|eukprot:KXS22572.1 hypothetical protein M427DRAFT_175518 [Gonapodya prolifera JEL478]